MPVVKSFIAITASPNKTGFDPLRNIYYNGFCPLLKGYFVVVWVLKVTAPAVNKVN